MRWRAVISVLCAELASIIAWAMLADCADHADLKFNKRMSGILGAGALFALKFGMSLAGAMVGWILAFAGYEGSGAAPTGEITWAILLLISILPGIFHLLGYLFLRVYPLTDARMEKIKQELSTRNAAIA